MLKVSLWDKIYTSTRPLGSLVWIPEVPRQKNKVFQFLKKPFCRIRMQSSSKSGWNFSDVSFVFWLLNLGQIMFSSTFGCSEILSKCFGLVDIFLENFGLDLRRKFMNVKWNLVQRCSSKLHSKWRKNWTKFDNESWHVDYEFPVFFPKEDSHWLC